MSVPDRKVLSEYAAFTEQAGVVALVGRSLIEVTGADRVQLLQGFCTNDVKRLHSGQGCEAFFPNHQGKTVGHGLIFVHDDSLVIETTPGQAPGLIAHLDRFVISEKVEFHDRSADWTELFVGGPKAGSVLEATTQSPPPVEMLSHVAATIGGRPVVLRRVGFTKTPGWLVQADASNIDAVRSSLLAAGAGEAGSAAFEMCRLEAAWPWFGTDITDANLPQEIDRNEQAISFTKGCYLGQETVARLDALGHVNRLLVAVELSGEEVPAPGTVLLADEKEVGRVTSAVWSPERSAPLLLALVRRTVAKPGSQLNTEGRTGIVVKVDRGGA